MKNTLDPGLSTLSKTAIILFSTVLLLGMGAAETLTVDSDGDYNNIQSAIDNADSGDTIDVTPGTYNEQIVIKRSEVTGIDIVSTEGADKTKIVYDGSQNQPTVALDSDNIKIEGFTVERKKSGDLTGQAVRIAGDEIQLSSNEYVVNKPTDAAISVQTDSSGPSNEDFSGEITDININEGVVRGGGSGLLVADDDDTATIANNAVKVQDVSFQDNDFHLLELDNSGAVDVSSFVDSNSFDNAAYPQEATGSLTGTYNIGNIVSDDIQTALDYSESDTTIKVSEGTYKESVKIAKNNIKIESLGNRQNTRIVNQDGSSQGIKSKGEGLVEISGDGVVVDGFNIKTQPTGINQVNDPTDVTAAVKITGNNAEIRNNLLQHNEVSAGNPVAEVHGDASVIEGNVIDSGLLYLPASSNTDIKENQFVGEFNSEAISTYNSNVEELEINGNTFENANLGSGSYAIKIHSATTADSVELNNNQFYQGQKVVDNQIKQKVEATHNYWGQATGVQSSQIEGDVEWRPYFPTEQALQNSNAYMSEQGYEVAQNQNNWAEDTNSQRSTSEIRSIAEQVAGESMTQAEVQSIVQSEVEGFVTESELESELSDREDTIEEQEETIEEQQERINELESEVDQLSNQMNQTLEVLEESGQAEVETGPTGSFTVTNPEEGNQGGGIGGFFSGLFG